MTSVWVVGVKVKGCGWTLRTGRTWLDAVMAALDIAQLHCDGHSIMRPACWTADTAVDDIFGQLPYDMVEDTICEDAPSYRASDDKPEEV